MKKKEKIYILSILIVILSVFVSFPVHAKKSSLKLNKSKITLYTGKSTTLKVKGKYKKVKWSSNNKKVATVNKKGRVTAKKPGKAVIICRDKKKHVCKCVVVVKKKNVSELNNGNYGVFLGVNKGNLKASKKKIDKYKIIVIDAQEFSKEQISNWKSEGHIVYSYLNVGSIETYRSYYKEYKHLALKSYDNWPDEYWIDVSDASWQSKIIDIGKSLTKKGVDGFFIDNTDVYYQYHKTSIYKGLENILLGLEEYTSNIIINGGDTFVEELIDNGKTDLISGVNQESVFSKIVDYEQNRFKAQSKETTKYYQSYLKQCKNAGLDVYIIEYTKDYDIGKKAKRYCDQNNYEIYITDSIDLD